jgi:hypothetical protein
LYICFLLSKSLTLFFGYYFQVCFDDDRSENLNSSFTRFVVLITLLVVCSSDINTTPLTLRCYVH